MTVKIAELMSKRVVSAQPHHSVEHLRNMMEKNKIHSVPIVGPEMEALGIITTTDLAKRLKDTTPVSRVMTRDVAVVPAYNDVSVAARIMRKNKIHHVIVTHEKKVVGIISSFDLLKLVEDHRYVAKKAPTPTKKKRRS